MNSYLDDALVGALLLISAAYAISALGPRNLRRRVLAACSRGLSRAPAALGLRRAAQRFAHAAEAKPQGACGGCDNCANETPLSATPRSGAASKIAATEIQVPIASIGRARR
jgi:hypothetical protein